MQIEDEDFSFTFFEKLAQEQHEKLDDLKYYEKKNLTIKDVIKRIKQSRDNTGHGQGIASNFTRRKTLLNVVERFIQNKNKISAGETFDKNISQDSKIINKDEEFKLSWDKIANLHEPSNDSHSKDIEYNGDTIFREICLLETNTNSNHIWIFWILITLRILPILSIQIRDFETSLDFTMPD